jgi:AmiR/NasT family two-component response regulator
MSDDSDLIEQLTEAVAPNRTTIGVALGILMERLDLSREAAFDCLRRFSSHHNRKLYDIAVEISETRRIPD